MNVTFLTSSRADFGILRPLIRRLHNDPDFKVDLLVFGTHLSEQYGATIKEIELENFHIAGKIKTLVPGNGPASVSRSIGLTYTEFATVWAEHNCDLIICLGDRYEMFAAVGASVPFNIPVAHISGGEVTEGAIDNIYRDAITLMSSYHFASTEIYRNNIVRLKGSEHHVYNVGALNIDNLKHLPLYSLAEFSKKYNIDLSIPTILITFHPETVSFENNDLYSKEIVAALAELKRYQLLITMPNADTMSGVIRQHFEDFVAVHPNAIAVESLGALGYMSCMKHCAFMLGNTSSGFVEASFFPKYVINLGNRQKGRIEGKNILNTEIRKEAILKAVQTIENSGSPTAEQLYGSGDTSEKIHAILKTLHKETH